jgi:hypothetical protein
MVDQMTADDSSTTAAQVKDAASKVTDEASTQASELTSAAKEHAGAVVSEAKEQARSVMHDAQAELQRQADQQAHRVGDGLRVASSQLQTMADGGEPGMVTDLTRQLAATLERFSTRIGDGGLRAVGDDLRGYARRQPGLFLLGAGVAGFVVARAVRAVGASSDASGPQRATAEQPAITPPNPTLAAGSQQPLASTPQADLAPVTTRVP